MKYPLHLLKIIEMLKRFPGVGTKSAERFAFQMLDWKEHQLLAFSDLIKSIPHFLTHCKDCGCLIDQGDCPYCDLNVRERSLLCVVASPKDVFAVEYTQEYSGLYHVLGGVLSPLDGIGAEHLSLKKLRERLQACCVQELIIALDSTLEGDATAFFLKREMENLPLKISRLAFGLPMGSSFDYVDGGTLARALSGRSNF